MCNFQRAYLRSALPDRGSIALQTLRNMSPGREPELDVLWRRVQYLSAMRQPQLELCKHLQLS